MTPLNWEKRGTPVATIISEAFLAIVRTEVRMFGLPPYPVASVPHPFGNRTPEWVAERADLIVEEIIRLLTEQADGDGKGAR